MPKINNNFLFLTHITNLGLPAELDSSVRMLEEKTRPNFNGFVVHAAVS